MTPVTITTIPAEQKDCPTQCSSNSEKPALSFYDYESVLIDDDLADFPALDLFRGAYCDSEDDEDYDQNSTNGDSITLKDCVFGFMNNGTTTTASAPKVKSDLPMTRITVEGEEHLALVDSGASRSCVSENVYQSLPSTMRETKEDISVNTVYKSASGNPLEVLGTATLKWCFAGQKVQYTQKMLIVRNLPEKNPTGLTFPHELWRAHQILGQVLACSAHRRNDFLIWVER